MMYPTEIDHEMLDVYNKIGSEVLKNIVKEEDLTSEKGHYYAGMVNLISLLNDMVLTKKFNLFYLEYDPTIVKKVLQGAFATDKKIEKLNKKRRKHIPKEAREFMDDLIKQVEEAKAQSKKEFKESLKDDED